MTGAAPVVIVGAGPTGLLAATLLGRYGVDCVLLDRRDRPHPQPRAVHLDDEVYRLLAGLGLGERFARISRPGLGLRLVSGRHAVLAQFDRAATDGRHGFPQANMFDQPDLEELLRDAVAEESSVAVRPSVEVVALRQRPDGVEVRYRDAVTGRPGSLPAAYVLGCDGANSVVRREIGSTMRRLGPEQRWLVLDVRTDADLAQWDGVHQVCDARRAATFMRVGPARYRWEFRLRAGETAADFARLDRVLPLIRPWTGAVPAGELTLLRSAEYVFRAEIATRWRSGRVFLLGDAAHLTPPFIGQGLSAGLRDAANLAWKLAGVRTGSLAETCLETYEAERKPHARAMIRLAVLLGVAMTAGGRPGELIRRLALPLAPVIPGLRAKMLDSATPPLRTAATGRQHRRLRGELCPNALLDDGTRLLDVPAGFWVITSVACPPDVRATVGRCGGRVVTVTAGSPLAAWLRSGRATVAVVRPDGTVFAAGRDVARVCQSLPAFPALAGTRPPVPAPAVPAVCVPERDEVDA